MGTTSISMREIRAIRDKNSLRHIGMTREERGNENSDTLKWFADKMGCDYTKTQSKRGKQI